MPDEKLEKYYEARFDMFASKGWKDLMEDVNGMLVSTNMVDGLNTVEDLHYCKGEVAMMKWILSLQEVSETAYQELKDASI